MDLGGWPNLSRFSFTLRYRGCRGGDPRAALEEHQKQAQRKPRANKTFPAPCLILFVTNNPASTERQVSGHDLSVKADASDSEQSLRSRAVKAQEKFLPYAVGRRAA